MIIKHINKSGKRTIIKCKNCNKEFSELNIHIKQGKGKFCCKQCYNEFRKKNKKDEKELNKLYKKKHKYNLSKEQYENLFKKQNNRCAICNKTFSTKVKGFVDHDHKTNKVRGLLCSKCNTLLGMSDDNIVILENAIKYLKNNL